MLLASNLIKSYNWFPILPSFVWACVLPCSHSSEVYEILARRAFGIPWDRCLEPFVPRRKGFRPHRVGQPNAKGVDADVDAGEVKEKASACSSGKETEEDRNTAVVHGGNAGAETEERDESSIRYLATPHDVVLI